MLGSTCLKLCNVTQQINIYICIYLLSTEIILVYVIEVPIQQS